MSQIVNLTNLPQFTAVNLKTDQGAHAGPIIIPQCAMIRIRWSLEDGHQAFNILYGRYQGAFGGTVAQANSLATALSTGTGFTNLLSSLHPSTSYLGVDIRDVNSKDQPLISSAITAIPGVATGGNLPNEVAAVITLRTALAGRANRGRMFVPGFAASCMAAGNIIIAGTVTAITQWAQIIPSAFLASGYTLVIGQKQRDAYTGKTGTPHPARDATSQAVTGLVVRDNHWDTQRRRGLK